MRKNDKRNNIIMKERLIFLIGILVGEIVFFRNLLRSDGLFSDIGDGRFTMLVTEHWYRLLSGIDSVSDLCIFYPMEGTLAYSDMLFSFGILHSLYRFLGFDMYLSYKFTLITVHVLGSLGLAICLRKYIRLSLYWTAIGVVSFSYSTAYAVGLVHTQLLSFSFLPFLLILIYKYLGSRENKQCRIKWGVLIIAFESVMVYTAWYTAWFTVLYGFIYFVCYQFNNRNINIKCFIASYWKGITGYILCAVIMLTPFLLISYPVLKFSGGRKYSEVKIFLPEFIDYINVTELNYLFGKIIKGFNLVERGYSSELNIGFSLILLGLFIYMIYCLKKDRVWSDNRLYTAGIISIVVSLLLMLRLSSNGCSMWYFVYKLFPAGDSIRAVARYALFLSLPMAVITAYGCDRLEKRGCFTKTYIKIIIFLLMFLSCITRHGVYSNWQLSNQYNFMNEVAAPPVEAKVFYIKDTSDKKEHGFVYQLDAYQIANHYDLKTINGYSGVEPPGWQGIYDVKSEGYEDAVKKWCTNHNLENVYVYDKGTNTWSKASF